MSEKFNLTLHWLLKFSTIDRLLQGDLGVKLKEIFFSKTKDEELEIQQNEILGTIASKNKALNYMQNFVNVHQKVTLSRYQRCSGDILIFVPNSKNLGLIKDFATQLGVFVIEN